MNIVELESALRQLRLGGMADVLETRLRQAQAEPMTPIDLLACLVSDELTRRSDRLLERRRKQAGFRDPEKSLDNFDFAFNPKMNRSLVFDLATAAFVAKREDVLFLGPGGVGKSHSSPGDWSRGDPAGLQSAVSRSSCAPRRTGRRRRRRQKKGVHGRDRDGSVPDRRRLRHAQAASYSS